MQRGTRSRRVLLACEMGGGLGHTGPLLRYADALAALGAAPMFALRNLPRSWQLLKRTRYPVLQAPLWAGAPLAGGKASVGASYADALAMAGYDRVDHLAPLVAGWRALLDVVDPALVIADYSPTLCLATHGRVPTFVTGFGFIVPPTDAATFPPLLAGKPALMPEADVLAVVQAVQAANDAFVPPTLPAMFAHVETFLTVLPQLDHYRASRRSGHLGPPEPLLAPQPWPTPSRYFAYLKATYPAAEAIVHALARTGMAGGALVLGADDALKARLRATGVEIHDDVPALGSMLPTVNVIVHHGGVNVAQQALAAGRAQLVLPEHLEQTLTGLALVEHGVGRCLHERYTLDDVTSGVRALATDASVQRACTARADEVAAGAPWRGLDAVIERARAVLAL